jgi:hypothetical protein
MSNKYVIQWKSKVNGRAGRGAKLFERDEGEELVQELNRDYPDIQHELVKSEAEAGTLTPPPEEVRTAPGDEENEDSAAQNPHVIPFDVGESVG